ncbi:hypothetical protein PPERSA_02204 [Pseudocohnilembus persalinus]|uniref:Phox homologous domain n=1 Tax=Pseudocohnilembus persalinus TaxID=266149 RepID=A0A0V0R1N7_PSEPJ|nr:hypothetical protein PPERSA_02204 [Pseudocohnilembus persalinus]|eukprot:KRX08072.1 hypothetical protein PPERSA_02204 [Pseudocohnilembus persalinus]
MTVPEHPQLRSSTAESAQFNVLNQSQQLLSQSQSESFLEDDEQNFCDFLIPEQVCVVGWDIVPDRNEIYFIIESETEEVIEFTKRSPKEFRILFKQLVKNDKSFNKAYQAMSKIKWQHLLMSFGQNDFRKLTQRQSEFNYSFGGGGPTNEIKKSILSNNGNRCSQKINNGYSFDMQQSLLDQSIISNSLSSYSYKEMSTQISYTYIYADKFEKNLLCEESEKYIYTIQFTNPQLKYNYQVKRTYSDFLSLSEYMQELYQNQSLDYNEQYNKILIKNNLNQGNIDQQDDSQDKDAENKREIINKFFVHVIKQRLWTLNLKLFLEQNKEQNIQNYIKNNQIMKDLYGSLLQSQQLYSNDNSSQVASVVIHSQFSGQKSSQTQKSHQSEFSFR